MQDFIKRLCFLIYGSRPGDSQNFNKHPRSSRIFGGNLIVIAPKSLFSKFLLDYWKANYWWISRFNRLYSCFITLKGAYIFILSSSESYRRKLRNQYLLNFTLLIRKFFEIDWKHFSSLSQSAAKMMHKDYLLIHARHLYS